MLKGLGDDDLQAYRAPYPRPRRQPTSLLKWPPGVPDRAPRTSFVACRGLRPVAGRQRHVPKLLLTFAGPAELLLIGPADVACPRRTLSTWKSRSADPLLMWRPRTSRRPSPSADGRIATTCSARLGSVGPADRNEDGQPSLTRRRLLLALGAAGGAGVVLGSALGAMEQVVDDDRQPFEPPSSGDFSLQGRGDDIVLSPSSSAPASRAYAQLKLQGKAGYDVTVVDARHRVGGRAGPFGAATR